jgi:hypothetical protein
VCRVRCQYTFILQRHPQYCLERRRFRFVNYECRWLLLADRRRHDGAALFGALTAIGPELRLQEHGKSLPRNCLRALEATRARPVPPCSAVVS